MSNGASKIQKDAAPRGKRHKLYLQSLKFLSIVDRPAMEPATISLIKRDGAAGNDIGEFSATARIVKTSDELVWGWAFVSKHKGEAYTDLQGDELDEESMLEVAKQFMSGDRASDTQHDEVATGEVVFAMPMTADIAKAFGVETDTHGLMIAVRPAPDVMAKVKAGELTGFSLGGTGIREPIDKAARVVAKRFALTGEAEGHQHLFDDSLDGGHTCHSDGSTGGYHSHCHPYTVVDGVVSIGMSAGHTHPANGGVPAEKTVSRAPAVKADPAAPTTSTATTTRTTAQETTMDPKQLIKAFASLTDDQVAYLRGLDEPGREEFLAKSGAERTAIVKAAQDADPVLHTTSDGREIRKSMDPHGILIPAIKRAEAADAAAAVAVKKANRAELEQRTEKLTKNLAGTLEARCAVVEAVEAIADPGIRKAALAVLASGNSRNAAAFEMQGFDAGAATDASPAADRLHKMAEDRVKATGETIAVAKAWLLDHDRTAQGLKATADSERRAARRGRA